MLNANLTPLISQSTSQSLDLGNVANALRFRKDQTLSDLATQVQQWADSINSVLQASTPTLQQLQVVDPNGNLIAWIGDTTLNSLGNVEASFIGYLADNNIYNISNISNASPPVVTTTAPHGYTFGDTVTISGSTVAAYNGNFVIAVLSTTAFSLDGVSAAGSSSTGIVQRYFAGEWGKVGAFGGASPFNASIKIQADGSVLMTQVTIVDTNGGTTITISPISGTITVATNTGQVTTLGTSGLTVTQAGTSTSIVGAGIISVGGTGAPQVAISYSAGVDSVPGYTVNNASVIDSSRNAFFQSLNINGGTLTVNSSGNVVTSGTVSASGYSVGGTAGVTGGPASVINTILTQTIQYKDWTSTNQSITVVTGFTLKSLASTSGIVTTFA